MLLLCVLVMTLISILARVKLLPNRLMPLSGRGYPIALNLLATTGAELPLEFLQMVI